MGGRPAARTVRERELDTLLNQLDSIRKEAAEDLEYAFDEPWSVFVRTMRTLTPQAYGTRIQNWIRTWYGWDKVDPGADRGDVRCGRKKYWEVKVTMITASNPVANFVQLRPHQDVDGYELFVIDETYTVTRFRISKARMQDEIAKLGQCAHGTKDAVAGNTNREYAIRFEWDTEGDVVKRWKAKYEKPSSITPTSTLPTPV